VKSNQRQVTCNRWPATTVSSDQRPTPSDQVPVPSNILTKPPISLTL